MVALEGAEGVAVGDLHPSGIVRVNGEDWSARSMNGAVRAGTPVQVLRVVGVRLEVWGDETLPAPGRARDQSRAGWRPRRRRFDGRATAPSAREGES